ncbi:MAG: prepilin-type N-terminal cleavage/methylation domain-containing protein [Parasphingorhabdus sp.]
MNEDGFTLVETLVALVVGAMLLGSISWVVSGFTRDLKAVETADQTREIARASTFLNRILSSARFSDQDGQPFPRSDTSLTFKTPTPLALGGTGYAEAKLDVVSDKNGQSLTFTVLDADVPTTRIVDGAKSISFDISESENPTYSGRFLSEVKIVVSTEDQIDPKIIKVGPKIDGVGACIFDVISQKCRT